MAVGDAPATQASADDPPIAAALAPVYIKFGRDLSLRISLMRKAVDDLSLDAKTRQAANDLIDGDRQDIDALVTQMQSGNLPASSRVMGVPQELKASKLQLYTMIGEQQQAVLEDILESLRWEALSTFGKLQLSLGDLKLTDSQLVCCQGILKDGEAKADSLPEHNASDGTYDQQREAMNGLFTEVHDRMAAVLTPEQQLLLGPRFVQLAANRPTTAPSPQKS